MFESSSPKTSSPVKTKGKTHKAHKMSSGKRRGRRLRTAIRNMTKKVARWERNQANPEKAKAGKKRPRHVGGWKTEGLKKQIEAMKGALNRA